MDLSFLLSGYLYLFVLNSSHSSGKKQFNIGNLTNSCWSRIINGGAKYVVFFNKIFRWKGFFGPLWIHRVVSVIIIQAHKGDGKF